MHFQSGCLPFTAGGSFFIPVYRRFKVWFRFIPYDGFNHSIGSGRGVIMRRMNLKIAWIAVGFSALIGIVFGIYPARKAARKKPIEALRFAE